MIGHTHHQFDRRVGDLRVVNAGSVGMAYEGEVAAYWTLVDDGEPSPQDAFDVERAVAGPARAAGRTRRVRRRELLRAVSRDEATRHFESRE